jgi:hypothetical protein
MGRNFDLLQEAEAAREYHVDPNAAAASVASAEPETTAAQKRVNVIFSAQQYQTLRELAEKQGINISDVLRQAINITKLVVEANQDGRILIQRRNGKVQQLKLV